MYLLLVGTTITTIRQIALILLKPCVGNHLLILEEGAIPTEEGFVYLHRRDRRPTLTLTALVRLHKPRAAFTRRLAAITCGAARRARGHHHLHLLLQSIRRPSVRLLLVIPFKRLLKELLPAENR